MPNTYNVGWLRDEENQIFIPFTYTKSVKLNDNGNTLNETVEMVDKHDAKISEIISGAQVVGVADLAKATKGQLKVGNVTFNGSENKEITAKDLGLTGALVYQGISTSKITDGGTQNPTINNTTVSTDNIEPGGIVLYKASDSKIYQEFVWTGTTWELLGDEGSYALKSIVINPGNGLSGGGDLSSNVGIEVSADGITITAESGTVAMVKAAKNTGTFGPTANISSLDPSGTAKSFTVPSIKVDEYGRVIEASTKTITLVTDTTVDNELEKLNNRKITAGAGLTGTGTLAADITLAVGAGTGIVVHDNDVALAEIKNLVPGNYGLASDVSPGFEGTFKVPLVTVDKYGRVTDLKSYTVTMPSKDALDKSIEDLTNRKISAGNGLSEANSKNTLAQDLTFNVNVGAGLKIDNDKVAHSNSVTAGAAQGSSGELTFDTTFNIPTVTYDSQGHITGSGTTAVKMPSIDSFNNGIANNTEQIANIIANIQGDENKAVDWNWNTNPRISALENRTKYMDASIEDSSFKIVDSDGDIGFKVDNNGATSLDFITDSGVSLETLSNTVETHGINIADIKTNYKKVQTAVSSPSASGTAVSFIDTISQDTQGKITATRKTVRTMKGATASADGTTGLVPAPTKGTQSNYFLKADGTWSEVAMSDTVNTTGSSNDVTNKLFIVGAKTQEESPITYSNKNVYINSNHLYSNAKQVVNLSDSQALTNKTYNGYTLAAACAKGVADSSSAGAIGTGTNLVTERDVYYGLPTINNSHAYTSSTKIYAPTGAGTSGYLLKANGGTSAPTWIDPTGLRVGEAANADYADALSNTVTINGTSFQSAGANITTSKWGTARNINITDGTNSSTVVSVDGSDAVTLNLPTTIKATLDGNAGTANKLKTAVALKVGNTSKNFDGSAELTWTHQEIGYANSISSGLLSAAAQTISGEKTFVNNVNVNGTLYPKKISVEETAWINDLIIENSVTVLGDTEFWSDIRCGAGPYNKGTFGYGKSLIFFDQNGFNDKNRLGMFQCYQSSSTSASEMWMKAMKPVANSTDWTGIYVHYYADGTQKSGSNAKFYGAVWNDYAEFRQFKDGEEIPYGRIVIENGDDSLSLSNNRLQKGGNVCSDTFGFAIGETEKTKMPIAVAGRALVYTYEDRNSYAPGDAVCSGPNGTVSKMTREEIKEYPDCIIGYVSAIPDYEIWGEHNTIVDGRIWIKVV